MGEAGCGLAIEILLVPAKSRSASLSSVGIPFLELRFREPIRQICATISQVFVSFNSNFAHLKEQC